MCCYIAASKQLEDYQLTIEADAALELMVLVKLPAGALLATFSSQ